jgi:excisionase family DNA binding protein
MEQLLDAREVAALLGLSRQQIYILSEQGILPSYKIGASRRFAPEDIKAWLETHKQGRVMAS